MIGPWQRIADGLPPLRDEGWRLESDYVAVRYVRRDGSADWCRGFVAVYREEGEPERIEWRTDGENWDIDNPTHYAQVNLA